MGNNPLFNQFGNNITDDMFNQISQQAMELKKTIKIKKLNKCLMRR